MSQAGSMMSMMAGNGGMMSGTGGMINGQNGVGPAASAIPDSMQQHHLTSSPVPTR